MKVLHVIPSVSLTEGGPAFAISLMARALVEAGLQVDVATTDDNGPGSHLDVPLEEAIQRDGARYFHFRKQTEFYKFSRPLRQWLSKTLSEYDLVHIHALFSYPSICAARIAKRLRIPYIIRPLGVLNRWGMANRRRWLKRLSFRFIEAGILRGAAAMHYTSERERVEAENAGATARSFIIPIGLDIASFQEHPGNGSFCQLWPEAAGREIVLFLSRIHQKKGLDLLLEAFAEVVRFRLKACLVIAGSGEQAFIASLHDRAERLGIASDIIWTGFLEGVGKASALAAARVFVLPSYSENFGVAAVEALAAGVPVVLTEEVAISEEVRRHDAGLVVYAEPERLAAAILRLLNEPEVATRISANGRRLAADQYSLAAMGRGITEMYQSVLTRT